MGQKFSLHCSLHWKYNKSYNKSNIIIAGEGLPILTLYLFAYWLKDDCIFTLHLIFSIEFQIHIKKIKQTSNRK